MKRYLDYSFGVKMRVLDIDLDFFLADCCPLAAYGERPDCIGHEPWDEAEVISFLENNCGLSSDNPIPGRIFDTHDKALQFWMELQECGKLCSPFHITHIDAHSDLGIGKPGPGYVLNTVLALSPSIRTDLTRYYAMEQLDEANYLLFALALRLVASLDNVRSPKSRHDIPDFASKDSNGEYSFIHLSSFVSKLFESTNGSEPIVPFRVYSDYRKFYSYIPYDFISLAISPRYSPAAADRLIPIIARYISII